MEWNGMRSNQSLSCLVLSCLVCLVLSVLSVLDKNNKLDLEWNGAGPIRMQCLLAFDPLLAYKTSLPESNSQIQFSNPIPESDS